MDLKSIGFSRVGSNPAETDEDFECSNQHVGYDGITVCDPHVLLLFSKLGTWQQRNSTD